MGNLNQRLSKDGLQTRSSPVLLEMKMLGAPGWFGQKSVILDFGVVGSNPMLGGEVT